MKDKFDKLIEKIAIKNKISSPVDYSLCAGGQINHVYSINNQYILKIEGDVGDTAGIFDHQVEMTEKLLPLGAKVPKIFDCGRIDGKGYLLMEKVKGKNLIYDWLQFSNKQKESFIYQITEQMRIYHSISYSKYSIRTYLGKESDNFKDAVACSTDFRKIDLSKLEKEHREDVEFLQDFYYKKIDILDEKDTSVLVHNDLYYGNIFFQNDELTGIIDFDWSCQAAKDYELWKFIDFVHSPDVYVDKKLESKFKKYDARQDLALFKKHYPELFDQKNLADRIRLYYLNNLIMLYSETQAGRWSERVYEEAKQRVDSYYRGDWLEKVING